MVLLRILPYQLCVVNLLKALSHPSRRMLVFFPGPLLGSAASRSTTVYGTDLEKGHDTG
jgi:hypothetical protein